MIPQLFALYLAGCDLTSEDGFICLHCSLWNDWSERTRVTRVCSTCVKLYEPNEVQLRRLPGDQITEGMTTSPWAHLTPTEWGALQYAVDIGAPVSAYHGTTEALGDELVFFICRRCRGWGKWVDEESACVACNGLKEYLWWKPLESFLEYANEYPLSRDWSKFEASLAKARELCDRLERELFLRQVLFVGIASGEIEAD